MDGWMDWLPTTLNDNVVAPEIFAGASATAASDIWSLGITIIELLTGNTPYYNMLALEAIYHIMEDDVPPLPSGISSVCDPSSCYSSKCT